jgi:hypothetical protein
MKVLYLRNSAWEYDFFEYDIFHNLSDIEIQYFDADELSYFENDETLINNCMLIVNHAAKFDHVYKFAQKINPLIIFHLSDEDGDKPFWFSLANHCKMYFRQYNHPCYQHSYKNVYQIPLAYVTGFLSKNYSFDIIPKKISERKYSASFVGEFKSDREYMCKKMQEVFENTYIKNVYNKWKLDELKILPNEMFDIYNDSIFVPVGRGNRVLDCSRVYEGAIAGAIPVIVAPMSEIQNTFFFNNNIPPFLYFENWDLAAASCKELINDLDKLQNMQDEIRKWWYSEINKIQDEIYEIISNA